MSKRRWTYYAKGKGKDCGKLKKPSPYLTGGAAVYHNQLLPGRIIGLRLTDTAILPENPEMEKFSGNRLICTNIHCQTPFNLLKSEGVSTTNTHTPFT